MLLDSLAGRMSQGESAVSGRSSLPYIGRPGFRLPRLALVTLQGATDVIFVNIQHMGFECFIGYTCYFGFLGYYC